MSRTIDYSESVPWLERHIRDYIVSRLSPAQAAMLTGLADPCEPTQPIRLASKRTALALAAFGLIAETCWDSRCYFITARGRGVLTRLRASREAA